MLRQVFVLLAYPPTTKGKVMKKKIAIAVAILLTLGIATSYAGEKYWIKVMNNASGGSGLSKWCDNHNLIYLYVGMNDALAVVPKGC